MAHAKAPVIYFPLTEANPGMIDDLLFISRMASVHHGPLMVISDNVLYYAMCWVGCMFEIHAGSPKIGWIFFSPIAYFGISDIDRLVLF